MLFISESVIEAMKENQKRQVAEQVKRSNQLSEARDNRSKRSNRITSFLSSARKQLNQMKDLQHSEYFNQSDLAERESQ